MTYIISKLKLQSTHQLVDWLSIGAHHKSLSWQRRATRLKFIFRWAPTNSRLHAIGQKESPTCLLCNEFDETIDHVMCYNAAKAKQNRKQALDKLEKSLVSRKTHPVLTTMFTLAVQDNIETVRVLETENEYGIRELTHTQGQIGWHLVKYGILSVHWRRVQQQYMKSKVPNLKDTACEKWIRNVQSDLWDYVHTIWEHRNKRVHGRDKEEAKAK